MTPLVLHPYTCRQTCEFLSQHIHRHFLHLTLPVSLRFPVQGLQDSVRNVHIDLLRQTFMMKSHMEAMFEQVVVNQEQLSRKLEAMQQQMDQLLHNGGGWM